MFGLDLTTGEKVQIGAIALILSVSAFMFFQNSRPVPNTTVTAWVEVRKFPVDPAKPMTRENPADPKKEATISVFGCHDGKLEIREYLKDPSRKPVIAWREIDKRRKTFVYYKDPMAPVKSATDPYKHAIALAAYNVANGRRLGLMEGAKLTPEQIAEEGKARKIMMDALAVTKIQVNDGTFRADLLKPVLDALQAYRGMSGDPTKDQKKADAARKVIDLAAKYLATVEEYRYNEIEKYIASMGKILTSEQREVIAKAGEAYKSGTLRMAAAPRIVPPAAPNANRGGGAGAQNRANTPANTNPQNRGNAPARRGSTAPVRNVEAVTG